MMDYVAANPEIAVHVHERRRDQQLVSNDFVGYYSEFQAQNFAAAVWTNNALLTAQCLASGVLIVPVLYLLGANLFSIGLTGGVMIGAGAGDVFFTYIAPHGFLELTSVFVGAGVGLRIGWAWIAPGPHRTRGQALAERARSGMLVALGLVLVLLVGRPAGGVRDAVAAAGADPDRHRRRGLAGLPVLRPGRRRRGRPQRPLRRPPRRHRRPRS